MRTKLLLVPVACLGLLLTASMADAQTRGTAGGYKATSWNRYTRNYGAGTYRYGTYRSGGVYTAPVQYQAVVTPTPVVSVDRAAHLTVRVPANAQIWIDNDATTQSGSTREFVSPPLDKGGTYHLRATWMEDGRRVESKRDVTVKPGQRLAVDLRSPPSRIVTADN